MCDIKLLKIVILFVYVDDILSSDVHVIDDILSSDVHVIDELCHSLQYIKRKFKEMFVA